LLYKDFIKKRDAVPMTARSLSDNKAACQQKRGKKKKKMVPITNQDYTHRLKEM